MVSPLDSKATFGNADAYVERVGNDITFKDVNNAAAVTLSELVNPRQTETTLLTLIKGAAAYRSPPPELVSVSPTTNTDTIVPAYGYDDTTEEFIVYSVQLPLNLDITGTVNVRLQWLPKAASSNNVVWKMYHKTIDIGQSFDVAMASKTVVSAGSSSVDVFSEAVITDTITNLGWNAGDNLVLHISRDAANGSDTLVDDAYLVNISIEAPVRNTGSTASVSAGSTTLAISAYLTNNATNPNYQLDYSADSLILADGNANQAKRYKTFYSVSTTFDITTDLDTGVEAASAWYYCWLVSTDGTSLSRKMSTSASSPSGLVSSRFRIRVGSIFNDGSSNFRRIRKANSRVEYQADYPTVASGTSVSAWTAVDISAYVPPSSKTVFGIASGDFSDVGHSLQVSGDNSGASSVSTANPFFFFQSSSSISFRFGMNWEFNLKTTQTIYWGVAATNTSKVFVGGYYEDLFG